MKRYGLTLHPTLQNMNFFSFWGSFLPSWIRIRIHWPDWIRIQSGSGSRSGSETLNFIYLYFNCQKEDIHILTCFLLIIYKLTCTSDYIFWCIYRTFGNVSTGSDPPPRSFLNSGTLIVIIFTCIYGWMRKIHIIYITVCILYILSFSTHQALVVWDMTLHLKRQYVKDTLVNQVYW